MILLARGDVVADNQSIASLGNLDFQPAAGVEVLITETGNGGAPRADTYLFNGTNAVQMSPVGSIDISSLNEIGNSASKFFAKASKQEGINNTRRLRVVNGSGATNATSFAGVQTK